MSDNPQKKAPVNPIGVAAFKALNKQVNPKKKRPEDIEVKDEVKSPKQEQLVPSANDSAVEKAQNKPIKPTLTGGLFGNMNQVNKQKGQEKEKPSAINIISEKKTTNQSPFLLTQSSKPKKFSMTPSNPQANLFNPSFSPNPPNSFVGNQSDPKKGNSFSLTDKQSKANSNGLSIFGNLKGDKEKDNKLTSETKQSSDSNPKGGLFGSLVGNSSITSQASNKEIQQKEAPVESPVIEEGSSQQVGSSKQQEKDGNKNILQKKNRILDFLKQKKEQNESLTLQSAINEIYQSQNENLKIQAEKIEKENKELAKELNNLVDSNKQLSKERDSKKNQQQRNFRFSEIIKEYRSKDPFKTHPDKNLINREIGDSIQVVQRHYFRTEKQPLNQSQQNSTNPEDELRQLCKSYFREMKTKQQLIAKQQKLMQDNAKKLNEIQALKVGGIRYLEEEQPESVISQNQQAYNQEKENELNDLQKKNEKKKTVYENARKQIRQFQPPVKRIEGHSSIIMRSTIFE